MAVNFKLRNIGLPTPDSIRRAANSVLAGCTFIIGTSFLGHHDTLMLVWAHIGATAKMASIFFAENFKNVES